MEKKLLLLREQRIRLCRKSFWEYCKTTGPKFYTDERWHLRLNCEVLQALYERRLTKQLYIYLCNRFAPVWYVVTVDFDRLIDDHIYTRLIENLPPRTGKSRTLVNFCKWILGDDTTNRVIACSYNDDLATTFSRYTRDGIQEKKTMPTEILFEDIFPNSSIKHGNASYKEWALDGEFFNYKGAGIGGSITGKGCNVSIVDDPVKDAETAYNEEALAKIWSWYTGTFLSRLEDEGKGGIEIVNHTRWASGDICGRILEGPEANEWLELKMEACYFDYDDNGDISEWNMLCPSLLSRKKYESLQRIMDDSIFQANYHQTALDAKGRLYTSFKTYSSLPVDEDGNSVIERVIGYGDTADEGIDHLCFPVAAEYNKQLFLLDVLYTKEAMEITEPAAAKMLYDNEVTEATIESNNGGRGYARAVEGILWTKHQSRTPSIKWFHQTKNKRARILSNATYVMNNVYFPINWRERWPAFAKALSTYQREGKNKHDDAPDALTGLVELILDSNMGWLDFYEQEAAKIEAAKANR